MMFAVFSYCTVWFIFYNEGPATWFENHYFVKNAGKRHESATVNAVLKKDSSLRGDFVERNIKYVLIVLGMFCIVVTYLLYIS